MALNSRLYPFPPPLPASPFGPSRPHPPRQLTTCWPELQQTVPLKAGSPELLVSTAHAALRCSRPLASWQLATWLQHRQPSAASSSPLNSRFSSPLIKRLAQDSTPWVLFHSVEPGLRLAIFDQSVHMIAAAAVAMGPAQRCGSVTRVPPRPAQLVPAYCALAFTSFKTIRGTPIGTSAPALPSCSRIPHLPQRSRQTRRRTLPLPPRAGLYSLPSDLVSSLQTGCGIAYLLALGFSALPILTGDSLERNERRFLQPTDEDSAGEWPARGSSPSKA